MNIIEFFGRVIKPKLTNGKKMWKPLESQMIFDKIYALQDKDVNLFLIAYDGGYISIDSGYKNSDYALHGLGKLGINPLEVTHVFLTHLDIDHAGGVDKNSHNLFPNAQVFLGIEEEKYLTEELFRKKVLFHNCQLPIILRDGYELLIGGQRKTIVDITLETFFAPGHTLRHTVYLVNGKHLFSGDALIANQDGGYSFYDFWNADSQLNKRSLEKMQRFCDERNVEFIVTAHSGVVSAENAFCYREQSPQWRDKNFVFIADTDNNPYI